MILSRNQYVDIQPKIDTHEIRPVMIQNLNLKD